MIKKQKVKAFSVEIRLEKINNRMDIYRILAHTLPQALQIVLDEHNRKYFPDWEETGLKGITIRGIEE